MAVPSEDPVRMRDLTLDEVERLDAAGGEAEVTLHMDEVAFTGFYDRTARPLWAYLARMTGDRQAADDLLQETYYRFLRAAATHESEQHRRHSLFVIATNLARDRRRRQVTRPAMDQATPESVPAAGTPDAADRFARRADLSRAMARLRRRERSMLLLAYAQGATHREIAAIVGVTPASVKPLLFRARRRLAQLLGRAADASPGGAR